MGMGSPQFTALAATFGATVEGVELRNLTDEAWAAIVDAWVEFGLLVFPDQHLSPDEQNIVARRLGPLEFEAAPLTNVRRDGSTRSDADDDVVKLLRGNEGWHHDSTYMPIQARGAVFSAEIVPTSGGATGWADMAAAYDALTPEERARIGSLSAHHSLEYSQTRAGQLPRRNDDGSYDQYGYHDGPAPLRPLVKTHPVSGRQVLTIGRHAHAIPGLADDESESLLDGLNADACRPPRVHHHEWTAGDVVIWDNIRLMHRATPFDLAEPRRMWHTRIAGDPATETAVNYVSVGD